MLNFSFKAAHRVCAVILASIAVTAGAQTATPWPTRPVRIVVPVGAGGTTDILARIVGDALAKSTGQAFIVDLKPGAGGAIGCLEVANAAPDGYTLLVGTASTLSVAPAMIPNLRYSARDFTPIGLLAETNAVLLVTPKLGVKSVNELLALGRQKPGFLNFASSGNLSRTHLLGEVMQQQSGVSMTHIPYKGVSQIATSLIAGEVHMYWDSIPSALQYIKDGRLLGLAISGQRRSPMVPNVPTIAEAGFPGISDKGWFGVYAPRGLSPELTTRINEELNKVLNTPEMVARFASLGIEPGNGSAADLETLVADDTARWRKVAVRMNIKAE